MRKDTVVTRRQRQEICSSTFRFLAMKLLKKNNESSLDVHKSNFSKELCLSHFSRKAWPACCSESLANQVITRSPHTCEGWMHSHRRASGQIQRRFRGLKFADHRVRRRHSLYVHTYCESCEISIRGRRPPTRKEPRPEESLHSALLPRRATSLHRRLL